MKTSLYYKLVYIDFTEFQGNFYPLNFINLEAAAQYDEIREI